jgi:hypothetical protein
MAHGKTKHYLKLRIIFLGPAFRGRSDWMDKNTFMRISSTAYDQTANWPTARQRQRVLTLKLLIFNGLLCHKPWRL